MAYRTETLWMKARHEVKDVFETSLKSITEFENNGARPIVFKKQTVTGQMSKSYHILLAEKFDESTKAILYFPKHPKAPLIYVSRAWGYKKLQLKISQFLRESNGEVSEDCIKVAICTNDNMYHCVNLDKTFEFFWCTGIMFNNGNKFNKVIKNCPLLVQTDGECRIKLIVGLVHPTVDYNDTHGKNDLIILTPNQFEMVRWPIDLRHVADADPRRRKRLLPKTVTKRYATATTMVLESKKHSMMVSNSEDIFHSDSDEADEINDGPPSEYEFPSSDYSDTETLAQYTGEHVIEIDENDRRKLECNPRLVFDDFVSMSVDKGEDSDDKSNAEINENGFARDNKGKDEEF